MIASLDGALDTAPPDEELNDNADKVPAPALESEAGASTITSDSLEDDAFDAFNDAADAPMETTSTIEWVLDGDTADAQIPTPDGAPPTTLDEDLDDDIEPLDAAAIVDGAAAGASALSFSALADDELDALDDAADAMVAAGAAKRSSHGRNASEGSCARSSLKSFTKS